MDIRDAFPSRFLKAADLRNQEVYLTITTVELSEIGDDEIRPVVHFEEARRGLLLNKTNAHCIASVLGHETQDWTGEQIVLFPTTTLYKGAMVDCIRVKFAEVQSPQDVLPAPPTAPVKQTRKTRQPAAQPAQPAQQQPEAAASGNGSTGGLDL